MNEGRGADAGIHCGPTTGEGCRCSELRCTRAPAPSAIEGERVWMSDSSNSGKFARDASKPGTPAIPPDEWQATRAEPASQDELDEWQATRIQARQSGIDEWRVRAPGSPTPGQPRSAGESPDAWASTRAQTALATQLLEDEENLKQNVSIRIPQAWAYFGWELPHRRPFLAHSLIL